MGQVANVHGRSGREAVVHRTPRPRRRIGAVSERPYHGGAIRPAHLRPTLHSIEYEAKVAQLRSLLSQGVGVKLVVRMRGREAQKPQVAMKMLRRFVDVVTEAGARED